MHDLVRNAAVLYASSQGLSARHAGPKGVNVGWIEAPFVVRRESALGQAPDRPGARSATRPRAWWWRSAARFPFFGGAHGRLGRGARLAERRLLAVRREDLHYEAARAFRLCRNRCAGCGTDAGSGPGVRITAIQAMLDQSLLDRRRERICCSGHSKGGGARQSRGDADGQQVRGMGRPAGDVSTIAAARAAKAMPISAKARRNLTACLRAGEMLATVLIFAAEFATLERQHRAWRVLYLRIADYQLGCSSRRRSAQDWLLSSSVSLRRPVRSMLDWRGWAGGARTPATERAC